MRKKEWLRKKKRVIGRFPRKKLPQLPDPEQVILVYCRSGNRSKQASGKLAEAGYKNIYEFGGIIDWTGETETGNGTGKEDLSEEAVTKE